MLKICNGISTSFPKARRYWEKFRQEKTLQIMRCTKRLTSCLVMIHVLPRKRSTKGKNLPREKRRIHIDITRKRVEEKRGRKLPLHLLLLLLLQLLHLRLLLRQRTLQHLTIAHLLAQVLLAVNHLLITIVIIMAIKNTTQDLTLVLTQNPQGILILDLILTRIRSLPPFLNICIQLGSIFHFEKGKRF